jgi:hypothetical protein
VSTVHCSHNCMSAQDLSLVSLLLLASALREPWHCIVNAGGMHAAWV